MRSPDHRSAQHCSPGRTQKSLTWRDTLKGSLPPADKRNMTRAPIAFVLVAVLSILAMPAQADTETTCFGKPPTIAGTIGDDHIVGTDGDDVILGYRGDDRIEGGLGNDLICTWTGNDVLLGGPGNDHMFGGRGSDRLYGEDGEDRLFGGAHADTLEGGPGNDHLDGEWQNDALLGGDGDDKLLGRASNDFLRGGLGNDYLDGGGQDDRVFGEEGDDYHHEDDGRDLVDAGVGNDTLNVLDDSDIIKGGPGVDLLTFFNAKHHVDARLYLHNAHGLGFDKVYGIENLTGTRFPDILYGDNKSNIILGLGGNESGRFRMLGLGGNDVILGGAGMDRNVDGGAGKDLCKAEQKVNCELK